MFELTAAGRSPPQPSTTKLPNSLSAQEPKNQRAQGPKSPSAQVGPRAQVPESPSAQEPKCPRAQVPESPRAQVPESPSAQEPKCPRAQVPKSPSAQELKRTRAQVRGVTLQSSFLGKLGNWEIGKFLRIIFGFTRLTKKSATHQSSLKTVQGLAYRVSHNTWDYKNAFLTDTLFRRIFYNESHVLWDTLNTECQDVIIWAFTLLKSALELTVF
jgi:hypothetical protein